ncbi:hypothetical protein MMSP_4427 [Mycobacterium sp. 012931]|nr:hypothetical protein MMSP_4427 [Mycobacterium sp. 012931]
MSRDGFCVVECQGGARCAPAAATKCSRVRSPVGMAFWRW